MAKKIVIALAILSLLCVVVYFATRKPSSDSKDISSNPKPLYGISGYVPVNYPNSNIIEIASYWSSLKQYAQIYGIHVNSDEEKTINSLAKNAKLPVDLVIGLQTPKDWENLDNVIKTLDSVLDKNKNIKYVGIGNEINIIKIKYPKEFNNFVSAFKEISKSIKDKYPDVKIFTTFQYDVLDGKAYLMGKEYDKHADWKLLKQFESSVDLFGFTVYPFLNNEEVKQIPDDYLSNISKYTNKPIAITETSWPTKELKGSNFVFTENEQTKYFEYLISKSEKMEFVNIAFLNDIVDWKDGKSTPTPLFDSIGIKYNDGSDKKALSIWKDLID